MDIGRAYTFIMSDPKWIAKVLIGAAVSLVPILNLALYGYALDVVKRVYQGTDLPLPEWDDFGLLLSALAGILTFVQQESGFAQKRTDDGSFGKLLGADPNKPAKLAVFENCIVSRDLR